MALDAWFAHQDEWIKKRKSAKKPRPIPVDVNLMILTGDRGRRLGEDAFRHKMIASYEKVDGLVHGLHAGGVTTHGLRYAAATRLYELGVSLDDIALITGHETRDMVEKYAMKKRAAKLAFDKLNTATAAQKSNASDKPDLQK